MGNKTLKQLKLQESQNFPHASYPADCPQTAQETTTDPAADAINSGVKFEPNLHSVCQDLQSNIKMMT